MQGYLVLLLLVVPCAIAATGFPSYPDPYYIVVDGKGECAKKHDSYVCKSSHRDWDMWYMRDYQTGKYYYYKHARGYDPRCEEKPSGDPDLPGDVPPLMQGAFGSKLDGWELTEEGVECMGDIAPGTCNRWQRREAGADHSIYLDTSVKWARPTGVHWYISDELIVTTAEKSSGPDELWELPDACLGPVHIDPFHFDVILPEAPSRDPKCTCYGPRKNFLNPGGSESKCDASQAALETMKLYGLDKCWCLSAPTSWYGKTTPIYVIDEESETCSLFEETPEWTWKEECNSDSDGRRYCYAAACGPRGCWT